VAVQEAAGGRFAGVGRPAAPPPAPRPRSGYLPRHVESRAAEWAPLSLGAHDPRPDSVEVPKRRPWPWPALLHRELYRRRSTPPPATPRDRDRERDEPVRHRGVPPTIRAPGRGRAEPASALVSPGGPRRRPSPFGIASPADVRIGSIWAVRPAEGDRDAPPGVRGGLPDRSSPAPRAGRRAETRTRANASDGASARVRAQFPGYVADRRSPGPLLRLLAFPLPLATRGGSESRLSSRWPRAVPIVASEGVPFPRCGRHRRFSSPREDVRALAAILRRAAADPALFAPYAARGPERARRFSAQEFGERMLRVYARAASSRRESREVEEAEQERPPGREVGAERRSRKQGECPDPVPRSTRAVAPTTFACPREIEAPLRRRK